MKPRLCPTCTAALNRPTRHAAKRYCSQVQAQARYRASEKGRKANREAQREHRRRTVAAPCARCSGAHEVCVEFRRDSPDCFVMGPCPDCRTTPPRA